MTEINLRKLLCTALWILLVTSAILQYRVPISGQLEYLSIGKDNNADPRDEQIGKSYQNITTSNTKIDDNRPNLANKFSIPNFIHIDKDTGTVSFGLSSFWKDPNISCNNGFKCSPSFSAAWKGNTSFQISTKNNVNNTWSSINGQQINVNPSEQYQLVTHMKLNEWVRKSHVVLDGYNETSKDWYQITHCPWGINGPLEWKEFSCIISIPANTTMMRPVLNAGWSSQSDNEAVTWFDSVYLIKFRSLADKGAASSINSSTIGDYEDNQSDSDYQNLEVHSLGIRDVETSSIDLYSNPNFLLLDQPLGTITFGLSSFWKDEYNSCKNRFNCSFSVSTGWNDKSSYEISTQYNEKNNWSSIYGQELNVKPNDLYQLVSHMSMNKWAIQSHFILEGFNKTSNTWYQLVRCPSGIDGPMNWREFSCNLAIPADTTKVRPVLNAGWSTGDAQVARTWFDSIFIIKLNVKDPDLRTEVYFDGLELPTKMAFLGPDDILVLEKNKGTVQRIVNGTKISAPVIDINVTARVEMGLLGVAIQKNKTTDQLSLTNQTNYVFLYFSTDQVANNFTKDKKILKNVLYRYELIDNKLVNPKLLFEVPAASFHNGGQITIGPDQLLYVIIGEVKDESLAQERNQALNNETDFAEPPDGRGGILRMDQNGNVSDSHGILGNKEPLNKYYAYGIRNGFGLDFDPISGKLWDSENGPEWGDEVNLVEPGFNSGWNKLQGIWTVEKDLKKGTFGSDQTVRLFDFGGIGEYSSPEFIWNKTVGPTAVKFLSTDKLGKEYENDLLVADVNNGRIYQFELNENRTAFLLNDSLTDKVADNDDELKGIIFAEGFGGMVTDLKVGPDGYLYIVGHTSGKLYRIIPGHPIDDIYFYLESMSNRGLITNQIRELYNSSFNSTGSN